MKYDVWFLIDSSTGAIELEYCPFSTFVLDVPLRQNSSKIGVSCFLFFWRTVSMVPSALRWLNCCVYVLTKSGVVIICYHVCACAGHVLRRAGSGHRVEQSRLVVASTLHDGNHCVLSLLPGKYRNRNILRRWRRRSVSCVESISDNQSGSRQTNTRHYLCDVFTPCSYDMFMWHVRLFTWGVHVHVHVFIPVNLCLTVAHVHQWGFPSRACTFHKQLYYGNFSLKVCKIVSEHYTDLFLYFCSGDQQLFVQKQI